MNCIAIIAKPTNARLTERSNNAGRPINFGPERRMINGTRTKK